MEDVSEPVVQSKVRSLVHAFESHTTYGESAAEQYSSRPRSKSIGHALTYKLFRDPNLQLNSLLDIEKELVKIDAHLNYYEYYDKETHVAFLEQLFEVLKALVSINAEGCETTKQKKSELIAETRRLSKILNTKLPHNSPRIIRRTENGSQREDNIVTTTGSYEVYKNSSEASTSSFYKSLESLSSLKDSTDQLNLSNDGEQSTSQNNADIPDTTVQSPTENQEHPKSKSVSKLKRFFSLRQSKTMIPIIPSSYSGVSRSMSSSSKSNKYLKNKEFKSQQKSVTEEYLNENEEEHTSRNVNLFDNEEIPRMNSTEEEEEKLQLQSGTEIPQGTTDERNTQEQGQTSVSVSKLKHFFEERREEENEGNYLNFVRVLRSTDINKIVDINKSKSMPNLMDQQIKSEQYDDDLDDNIDNQIGQRYSEETIRDLEYRNGFNEMNNNETEEKNTASQSSLKPVKVLKQTFENMNSEQDQVDQEQQDVNAILHREILPEQVHLHSEDGNSEVQISNFSEPALKVPIQLRLGPLINNEEVVTEETPETEGAQKTIAGEAADQTKEIKVEGVKEQSDNTVNEKSSKNVNGSLLLKSTDLLMSSSLIKGNIKQQTIPGLKTTVTTATAIEETVANTPKQQYNIIDVKAITKDNLLFSEQVDHRKLSEQVSLAQTEHAEEAVIKNQIVLEEVNEETKHDQINTETESEGNVDNQIIAEEIKEEIIDDDIVIREKQETLEIKQPTDEQIVTGKDAENICKQIIVEGMTKDTASALEEISSNEVEVKNEAASIVSEQDISDTAGNMALRNENAVAETQGLIECENIKEQDIALVEESISEGFLVENAFTDLNGIVKNKEIPTEVPEINNVPESTVVKATSYTDDVSSESVESRHVKGKLEGESIATPEISNFKESVSLVKVINENPPAKEVDETIEEDSDDVRKLGSIIRTNTTTASKNCESYITTSQDIDKIEGESTEIPEINNFTESASSIKVINKSPLSEVEYFEDQQSALESELVSGTINSEDESIKTPAICNFTESSSTVKFINEDPLSEVVETFEVENGDATRKPGIITTTTSYTTMSQDSENIKDKQSRTISNEEVSSGTAEISNFTESESLPITNEIPSSEVVETFEGGDGIVMSCTTTRAMTRTIGSTSDQSHATISEDINNIKDQQTTSESGLVSRTINNEEESAGTSDTVAHIDDACAKLKQTDSISNFSAPASSVNVINKIPSPVVETFEEITDQQQTLENGSACPAATTIRRQVISKEGQHRNSQIEVFVDTSSDEKELEKQEPKIINKKHSLIVPDLQVNDINAKQDSCIVSEHQLSNESNLNAPSLLQTIENVTILKSSSSTPRKDIVDPIEIVAYSRRTVKHNISPPKVKYSRFDEDSSVFVENSTPTKGTEIRNVTEILKVPKTKTRKTSSISLNESQENIIDQILDENDDIEHLEEDFEKLVKESLN